MKFTLENNDPFSNARSGILETAHGSIETPIFMPVGTVGTVKGIHKSFLENDIQAQIILGNTYHLYLRPGTEVLQAAGGLHQFQNWNNPILTDSGGYQVYSLSNTRKINTDNVTFKSHIDGSKHTFSSEFVIDIQRKIGADIIMAFDECTPYPCEYQYAKNSLTITHQWLDRCIKAMNNSEALYGYEQSLFPIVQGSVYGDLRKESAEYIAGKNADGNAIGGLSVGEPAAEMYACTEIVTSILPKDKPRYLMGVGTPENILECIALGIDMFDCVLPTRNGRHGIIYTTQGIIHIKNKQWATEFSPIDPILSTEYSLAYLRHLFVSGEMLGSVLASLQNLRFYLWLVKNARLQINAGNFASWKTEAIKKFNTKVSI